MLVGGPMDTKDKIMHVTLELILEQGFDTTSVSQITKKAGITKGAIYYFFENKEDLFEKVVERYFMDYMNNLVSARISETSSIKEQVRLFYDVKTSMPTETHNHPSDSKMSKNIYRLLQDGIEKYDKLLGQFKKFNDHTIAYQVSVLEEGKKQGVIRSDVNSKLLAENNMTWGRGMLHFDSSNKVDNVDAMVDEYFNIIWRSISTEDL